MTSENWVVEHFHFALLALCLLAGSNLKGRAKVGGGDRPDDGEVLAQWIEKRTGGGGGKGGICSLAFLVTQGFVPLEKDLDQSYAHIIATKRVPRMQTALKIWVDYDTRYWRLEG